MSVIRGAADTFRRDHLGACGNDYIRTPALDGLAARRDAGRAPGVEAGSCGGIASVVGVMQTVLDFLGRRAPGQSGRALASAGDARPVVRSGARASPPPADSFHGGNGRGAESHRKPARAAALGRRGSPCPNQDSRELAGFWGLHFAHIAFAESAYSHGDSPESAKSSPSTGFQTAG